MLTNKLLPVEGYLNQRCWGRMLDEERQGITIPSRLHMERRFFMKLFDTGELCVSRYHSVGHRPAWSGIWPCIAPLEAPLAGMTRQSNF